MTKQTIVNEDEWLAARKELLSKEKEFTRLRDELTRDRQQMPWRKIDKDYRFDTRDGGKSLHDLFAGRRQLLVYHFMFGPNWEEGCPSCSFWADNYNGTETHLAHRDTTLLAISNTSLDNIDAYKSRMNWTFEWVSSLGSDFNRDFSVTFTDEEVDKGEMHYNYRVTHFPSSEGPGISVFVQDDSGDVFHSYSTFARGLDMLNGTYHLLDLTPLGRDEKGAGKHNMYWLRRRDQYED